MLGVALLVYFVVVTTRENLAQLGVQSGFEFLHKEAGFAIAQTLIPYTEGSSILRAFCVALLNTLLLAVVSIGLASLFGLGIGIMRLSSNWLVAKLGLIYVEIFRNIPVLLQIFFWYFVVLRSLPGFADSFTFAGFVLNNRGLYFPTLQIDDWSALFSGGWHLVVPHPGRFEYEGGFALMPEFLALALGLSMYNASYIGEITRSGFLAVARGQYEAASALGLSGYVIFRRITFPQALRVMIPPLSTVYMNIFKATSLAAAIAYPDIVSVFVGTVNNLVGQPIEIMLLTLATYAAVSFAIAWAMNSYNRRIQIQERGE
nr:ABC transporter permease subunit [Govania unica]